MEKVKFTKTAIDNFPIPPSGIVRHWDTEITGFGLKITAAGKRVFIYTYRMGGRGTPSRTYTIRHDNPHQAREEAKRLQGMVAEGIDPAAVRKTEQEALKSDLIEDVAAQFIKRHVSQNRSAKETTRIINKEIVAVWGKRSIHSITKKDVNSLLNAIVDRGHKTMANRVFATTRKMFNWAFSQGIVESSPCSGVTKPAKDIARDRVLTDDELVSVLGAAHDISKPFNGIVQLLIYTAQRRSEVAEMEWDELDLNACQWVLPETRSKNGKAHTVHLSQPAVYILNSIPKLGRYVFATNPQGEKHFMNYSRGKNQLDDASGVVDWRLHDIRRTVATGMGEMKILPHIIENILNHQSGTISPVLRVYLRTEGLEECCDALDRWAAHVTGLLQEHQVSPPDPATDNKSSDAADNVYPINGAVG